MGLALLQCGSLQRVTLPFKLSYVTNVVAREKGDSMVQTQDIVTAERYQSGLTYQQWLDVIQVNKEKFQENYDGITISDEDAKILRSLVERPNGPVKMLVIGEDWCPDVYRGLPVLAKIAETAGMELRIFFRDERGEGWPQGLPVAKDIIQHYLKDGQFESVPTAIFYTKDMDYIAHWIERPQIAHKEQAELLKSLAGLPPEEVRRRRLEHQKTEQWANWRRETVREVRELLEQSVS